MRRKSKVKIKARKKRIYEEIISWKTPGNLRNALKNAQILCQSVHVPCYDQSRCVIFHLNLININYSGDDGVGLCFTEVSVTFFYKIYLGRRFPALDDIAHVHKYKDKHLYLQV